MARRGGRLQARAAARLVRLELRQYHQLLGWGLRQDRWSVELWQSPVVWPRQQVAIAQGATRDEWDRVALAYAGLDIVVGWHRNPYGTGKPQVHTKPREMGLETIRRNLDTAMEA